MTLATRNTFLENKSSLAKEILFNFNNAFQSIIEDRREMRAGCLGFTVFHRNQYKQYFKKQFFLLAEEINDTCNEIVECKNTINPFDGINKIIELIKKFNGYPARSCRLSCRSRHVDLSFGHLFSKRVVEYYHYLLEMIRYTCDDHNPDLPLTEQEIEILLEYFTDNNIGLYRNKVMDDPRLRVSFQSRESCMFENDTIACLSEISPDIPKWSSVYESLTPIPIRKD